MRFLLAAAIGFGVTCVLAGVLLTPPGERSGPPPLAFPALATRLTSADRIEIVHAGHVLWLERRGQVWGMARQGGYPVRPEMAEALMQALLTTRLVKPVPGTPEAAGLGNPFGTDADSGTFVRVLGTSGATLSAIVTGGPDGSLVRRPNDTQVWRANNAVTVSADPGMWTQQALPALGPGQIEAVADDGGLGSRTVRTSLEALSFVDVGPAPQHHPAPFRTVQLTLSNGSAVLTVGMEEGQPWLLVSGTSPWATRLAPYAFALPGDSPLAGL